MSYELLEHEMYFTCYKITDVSFVLSRFIGCYAAVDSRCSGFSHNQDASSLWKNNNFILIHLNCFSQIQLNNISNVIQFLKNNFIKAYK